MSDSRQLYRWRDNLAHAQKSPEHGHGIPVHKTISAEYFITLFDLRNPKITQKVIDIFQHEMTVDVPHLESFTAGDLGEKEHG